MPDKLNLFAWTMLGTCSFAVLGGMFGAVAGGLSWKNGRAAGSNWAARIAAALAQLFDRQLSVVERGVLIGAVDGALFLGLCGTLLGLIAAYSGNDPGPWVLAGLAIAVPLVVSATLFGLLAYGLLGPIRGALLLALLGGAVGAFLVGRTWGVSHLVPGMVGGLFTGASLGFLFGRRR